MELHHQREEEVTSIKSTVLWDYAMRGMVPIALATAGFVVRGEIRDQSQEERLLHVEAAVVEWRQFEHDRAALDRQILGELNAIRVAIARLEERIAK